MLTETVSKSCSRTGKARLGLLLCSIAPLITKLLSKMPLDEQSLEYLARLENEEMIASDEEDETETQGASESSTQQTQATQTPFRYVEYEKVRTRDRYLNPNFQHICRQTAGADVFRRYEFEKEKLKKVFAEYKGRFCFTADMWTARATMKGYLCLTAHYVDDST
ncbi:unnamed protein product [Microthlaspi erraticum]|uniref:Uncharacterized protein n=1 Tax=Microthlaspi erraticum TaxID=1685480 RepID=A0A6D2KRV3_9BRAS|nr:unnamed protein product [Microthlaspi erraticum]